jgi:hypothetical protein
MPTTALGEVIRMLTAAREAAIDVDEDIARAHPDAETHLAGVTFPIETLNMLIEALQASERLHGAQARLMRRLQWAALACSVLAILLTLFT